MKNPEISYFSIRLIARFPTLVPVIVALGVVLVMGSYGGLGTVAGMMATLVAAMAIWFVARLIVELVVVIADTLLPR